MQIVKEEKRDSQVALTKDNRFKMDRNTYKHLLNKCREGDATFVRLRGSNLIFFGANFAQDFPSKNLYKALNVAKPD